MEEYVIISWPESQELMDKSGFEDNCYLINDDKGICKFGALSYFVNKTWYEKIKQMI